MANRSTVSFNACAKALERGSLWQLAVDLFEKLTEALEPDACLVCDFWCQLMSVCHPTVYWVYPFFFKSCSRTLFEDFEEWTIFYMSIGTGLTNCRSIAPYCTNCSSTIGSCQAIGMDPQL
jgi:hypothetical protein